MATKIGIILLELDIVEILGLGYGFLIFEPLVTAAFGIVVEILLTEVRVKRLKRIARRIYAQ